eukprot:4066577-Alexandrium_andersonii.AAC.1
MSASLVGSEMCIRDRPRPGFAPAPEVPLGCRGQGLQLREFPRALSRAPVSYTHLTLPTICSV